MVLEPDNGRYASLLVVPRRGVDTRRCASKDTEPQIGGGFGGGPTSVGGRKECQRERWPRTGVDCDVPHWLGRRTNRHL